MTSNSNLLHETLETCVRSTATFIHFANALKLAHYERSRMEAVAYGALKHRAKAYSTTTKINIHYAVKHITLTQPMLANFRYNSFLNSFRGVHRSGSTAIPGRCVEWTEQAPIPSPCSKNQFNIWCPGRARIRY